MVTQYGAVRVAELAAHFHVDIATIRRDLQKLEEAQALRRVRGGAIAISPDLSGTAAQPLHPQDTHIGQAVMPMIAEGETVFLGPGRLTLAVAHALTARNRITVVTNSLEIAHWVARNTPHTLIVTGGQLEHGHFELTGTLARNALASLRADHVILELSGISPIDGLTVENLSQAEVARILLDTGAETVALISDQRIGRVAAAYIAPASEIDVLVTSRQASSALLWDLSELGIQIVLA